LGDKMTKANERRPPKFTDAERHKRFVETLKETGASDKIADFENAFTKLTSGMKTKRAKRGD
jgi:hypothetical protein